MPSTRSTRGSASRQSSQGSSEPIETPERKKEEHEMLDNPESVLRKRRTMSRSPSVLSVESRRSSGTRVGNGGRGGAGRHGKLMEDEAQGDLSKIVEEEDLVVEMGVRSGNYDSSFLERVVDEESHIEQEFDEDTETDIGFDTPIEDESTIGMNSILRIERDRVRPDWMLAPSHNDGRGDGNSTDGESIQLDYARTATRYSFDSVNAGNPRATLAAERGVNAVPRSSCQSTPTARMGPSDDGYPSDDNEVLPPDAEPGTSNRKLLLEAFRKHMGQGLSYWIRKPMSATTSIGLAGVLCTLTFCSAGNICQDIGWLHVILAFFFDSPFRTTCHLAVLVLVIMGLLDFGEGVVKIWINIGKWSARQKPKTHDDTSLLPLKRWAQCLSGIPWQEIGADAVNKIWDPLAMLTSTLAFRSLLQNDWSHGVKGCSVSLFLHCMKWAIHGYEDVYLPIFPRTYPRRLVKRPLFTVVFACLFSVAVYIHWELVSFSIPATWRSATAYRQGQGYSSARHETSRWTTEAAKDVHTVLTMIVTREAPSVGTVTPPAMLSVD